MIAGFPAAMMLPMLRAKGVTAEDGAKMARDLFGALKAEDRAYIGGIVGAFAAEWATLTAPRPAP